MITTAFINIWNKRVGAIAWNVDTELASLNLNPTSPKWKGEME